MNIHSDQIDQITVALAKAQKQLENPTKDSKNPFFKSSYADLAAVLEACRDPLADNGLAVTQVLNNSLDIAGVKQCLVTILSHTSGQWIKSFIELPLQKPGPQELGLCITYCRRYALAAMVGIYQVDDDAESIEAPHRGAIQVISDKQYDFLMGRLRVLGEGQTFLMEQMQIESLKEIPKEEFNRALDWVNKSIEAKQMKKGARHELKAS